MPTTASKAAAFLQRHNITAENLDALAERLRPLADQPPVPHIPGGSKISPEVVDKRWGLLQAAPAVRAALADAQTLGQMEAYQHHVENFIGTVKVPIGLAGPLRVNGLFARGDYYLPLATTEAAMVASYSRGAAVVSEAGGCAAMLVNEGVTRAPGFVFRDIEQAGRFIVWALSEQEAFRKAAEATTHHGHLTDLRFAVEGNHVYLTFEFDTGSAAGQNMVTIATQAICDYIQQHSPVQPAYFFVEANLSGDKKASSLSFHSVRGKKVVAEVRVPADMVRRLLHTSPEMMVNYWRMSALGGIMSGTIGVHGHYANGLAALFIACGQDAACVAESAVGITRFELTDEGGLYASVSLPNIIVGTVGGGTSLPSQQACLQILRLPELNQAQALAEICAGLCLAGELSIIAALSSHQFSRAHARLARGQRLACNPGSSSGREDK